MSNWLRSKYSVITAKEIDNCITKMACEVYEKLCQLFAYQKPVNDLLDASATSKGQLVHPHYIEFRHEDAVGQARNWLLLIDEVQVTRQRKRGTMGATFTCPLRTFALFVHNHDIDVTKSEVLRLFDGCCTSQDVA